MKLLTSFELPQMDDYFAIVQVNCIEKIDRFKFFVRGTEREVSHTGQGSLHHRHP